MGTLQAEAGEGCAPGDQAADLNVASLSVQVTLPVPSEESSLPGETAGRKECPHCLPDEQQPRGQQEADPLQVGFWEVLGRAGLELCRLYGTSCRG